MTEIRKVKGGSAVHYEQLSDEDKIKVLNHIKELNDAFVEDKFKGKGSMGASQHRMRKAQQDLLRPAIQSIKDRYFPLREDELIGDTTKWIGYVTKEEAMGLADQASGDKAKRTRWATGAYQPKEKEVFNNYEEMLEDSGLIRDESVMAFLSTYLEEGEVYGTGGAGDKPYRERREDLDYYIKVAFDMVKTSINNGECFGRNVLDKHGEVFELASGQGGANKRQRKQLTDLGNVIQGNLCPDERKSNTDQQLLNALDDIMGELKQADPDEVFDRAPRPPEDMYDRRPKNPEFAKSWWDTLKTAGAVTTGNPGTKDMFNNKVTGGKPKNKHGKYEEEYPKDYPIVPEDKDFWRD